MTEFGRCEKAHLTFYVYNEEIVSNLVFTAKPTTRCNLEIQMSSRERRIQLGELIDRLINEERIKDGRGLTEYIEKKVSPDANLSSRQIGRIRDISSDFPEGDAVLSLAKVIPNIGVLDPDSIANRLLWRGQDIWYDQANLIKEQEKDKLGGQSVVIISADHPPVGLTNDGVVRSIANNLQYGFTYTFIYPHSFADQELNVEQWIENLKDRVAGVWYDNVVNKKTNRLDRRKAAEALNKFNEELDTRICFHQIEEPNQLDENLNIKDCFSQFNSISNFWKTVASKYCVLYNLGLSQRSEKYKYGASLIKGDFIRQTDDLDSVKASGWLYLSQEEYKNIEKAYKQVIPDWTKLVHESFKEEV